MEMIPDVPVIPLTEYHEDPYTTYECECDGPHHPVVSNQEWETLRTYVRSNRLNRFEYDICNKKCPNILEPFIILAQTEHMFLIQAVRNANEGE